MIKKILYIILFILNICIVLASTPNINITDELNLTVYPGNDINLGRHIISIINHTPTIVSMDNLTDVTLQQYDQLNYIGTHCSPVEIIRDNMVLRFLLTGESYTFLEQGVYNIRCQNNLTNNKIITIQEPSKETLNIQLNLPVGVNINNFTNTRIVDNSTIYIPFNINISEDIQPGLYNFSVIYNTLYNSNITRNYNLDIKANNTWVVDDVKILENVTINTGDSQVIGEIFLRNIGHIDIPVNFSVVSDRENYLILPSNQQVFRRSILNIPVRLNIPVMAGDDLYNYNLTISSDNKSEIVPFSFRVRDIHPPEILNITLEHDLLFFENNINAILYKNEAVASITVNYLNQTFPMTRLGNVYRHPAIFNESGDVLITVCATDNSNNTQCMNTTKTLNKINLVNISSHSVKFPTKKYSQYSEINLFEYLYETPQGIIINIENLIQSRNDTNVRFRIRDGNGQFHWFPELNRTLLLTKPGNISLQAISDKIGDFDATVTIQTPSYANSVDNIHITGNFVNYDVPEPFNMDWFGNELTCRVINTGDLDSTLYDCNVKISASVMRNDLPIPISLRERERLDTQLEEVRTDYKKQLGMYSIFITLLMLLSVVVVIISYIMVNVLPYLRLYHGRKRDDDD